MRCPIHCHFTKEYTPRGLKNHVTSKAKFEGPDGPHRQLLAAAERYDRTGVLP